MAEDASILQRITDIRQRFGWPAMLLFVLHAALNKLVRFEWLDVIVLDRQSLRPMPTAHAARFTSRIASREDLLTLSADPQWEINDEKLANFEAGDCCVLSLMDGRIAGYTWVHAKGLPDLLPGLRLSLPGHCLYNYAGLTAPSFRGAGLQSMRHHSVLAQSIWQDRELLVGYVRHTNFASRKGQSKSGYRKVGSIWMLGNGPRAWIGLSASAKRLGIALAPPSARTSSAVEPHVLAEHLAPSTRADLPLT